MARNSSLIDLAEEKKFKDQNLSEWEANSDFWLKGEMRHITDVKGKTIEIIQNLIANSGNEEIVLVDIGCGEGWVYRAIIEAGITNIKYYGVDFNESFIVELNKKHKDNIKAIFLKGDIENNTIENLIGKADIVVNAFNFFEIPNLTNAMLHTSQLLKENGYLLILTIDPITQLLSVSDSTETFYEYLAEYKEKKNRIGYKKRIVIGDKKTDRNYYGILYSLVDYLKEAEENNLEFKEYSEILNPAMPTPQLYQFMIFKKIK